MTEDAEIETAAVVIEHLLRLVDPEKRAAVLAKAIAAEDADREERQAAGGRIKFLSFSEESTAKWLASPAMRNWHDIMAFKARLAYVFIRNIRNNHSPKDAAKLLFERHRMAPGSGYLEEYIDDLPRPDLAAAE